MMSHPTTLPEEILTKATPHENNYSQPLISTSAAIENDEDEWEYDYSTTETEIYYVTLDLTTADNPPRHKPPLDEGPKRLRWSNPSYGVQARTQRGPTSNIKVAPTYSVADKNASASSAPKPAESSQNEVNGDFILSTRRPTQVQILELETDNPIVSYNGQFYNCQWASNVGTEMLFTARDQTRPLPRLRRLPDKVDLLAASSARIIAEPIQLKRKGSGKTGPIKASKKRARFDDEDEDEDEDVDVEEEELDEDDRDGYSIPIWKQSSDQRKQQSKFLSEMIRAKEEKGDKDMVTVTVKKRMNPEKWKGELKRVRRDQRIILRNIINSRRAASEDVEEAKQKLKEMEEEDELYGWGEDPADLAEAEGQDQIPSRGPGSRRGKVGQGGGTVRRRRARGGGIASAADLLGNTRRGRGRPRKSREASSAAMGDSRASFDTSTHLDFSDQLSNGTPGGFGSNMAETPRDFKSLMASGNGDMVTPDGDFDDVESGYSAAPTPNGGFEDEESPSQQLFNDMDLHDMDAPGEDDDTPIDG